MKKLDHPNIIKILEYFIEKGDIFIIMEYCEGGMLTKMNLNNSEKNI